MLHQTINGSNYNISTNCAAVRSAKNNMYAADSCVKNDSNVSYSTQYAVNAKKRLRS